MGLRYDGVSVKINEDKLWMNGRHMIGPGHRFIKFPKEQRTVSLTGKNHLPCRTKDGLRVVLGITYQYQLKDVLPEVLALYYDFGENYEGIYARVSRDVLRDVASQYDAYDIFLNRTFVQQEMTRQLGASLDKHHARVNQLQLLSVTLPEKFDAALDETEQARLLAIQADFDKKDAQQAAENTRNRADEDARTELNKKEGQISAEITSYTTLKDNVDLTSRGLMTYIWLQNLGTTEGSTVIFNSKPPDLACYNAPDRPWCNVTTA
ncbi:unnamed protein product [Vitrella brassicaformis CCMP3155]|uniref:Band 7 domain-containing protein n=1 Tax=Vitrella brassicaformis (strain CCMP3155) TaxID=1169540 RepID=A0A0G4EJI0_VITBC|nr:unnamed protein product [Vitrella brassicaformis CCMP3155]|eukprot:CEL96652.1 unnamed protein product [Vitrella brassicaformis CCMP3155]